MTIGLHNLTKRPQQKHKKKRIGRGNASGKGTYSGKGIKGQRSRSGGKKGLLKRSIMRQLVKKIPKLGGFKSQKSPRETVTLLQLQNNYSQGELVNLISLWEKRIIPQKAKSAKIVATGMLSKKLIIDHIALSKGAEEIVKSAGGEIR